MRFRCVIVAALLPSCTFQHGQAEKQRLAFEECDKSVSESLLAPSTYKVAWRGYREVGRFTFEEYQAKEDRDIARLEPQLRHSSIADQLLLNGMIDQRKNVALDREAYQTSYLSKDTSTGLVIVEYDSQNTIGVPLRSFSYCRVRDVENDPQPSSRVIEFGAMDRERGEREKAKHSNG